MKAANEMIQLGKALIAICICGFVLFFLGVIIASIV